MRGSAITGWGMALPPRVVTNDDLATIMDTSDDWIRERTGIHSRRVATGPFVPVDAEAPSTPPKGIGTTATLAIEAGARAITAAGLEPHQIGLFILCTTTPDQAVPATSAAVSAALDLRCGAFDLNTACSGFVDQPLIQLRIRSTRFVILDQFDRQHEPGAAHVADLRVTGLQPHQPLT